MKRKILISVPLFLLFSAKYVAIYGFYAPSQWGIAMQIASALSLISAIIVILLSQKFMVGRRRLGAQISSALSLIGSLLWFPFPTVWLYTLYGIFLATGVFILLYDFHHYEIKKYPAFGYAFLVVYILLEGTAMWRGNYNLPVLIIYLTLSLVMFLPGIKKIRE